MAFPSGAFVDASAVLSVGEVVGSRALWLVFEVVCFLSPAYKYDCG